MPFWTGRRALSGFLLAGLLLGVGWAAVVVAVAVHAARDQATGADAIVVLGAAQYNGRPSDRKSTRLNSSHRCISYAVFCLKKKKKAYDNKNNVTLIRCNVS